MATAKLFLFLVSVLGSRAVLVEKILSADTEEAFTELKSRLTADAGVSVQREYDFGAFHAVLVVEESDRPAAASLSGPGHGVHEARNDKVRAFQYTAAATDLAGAGVPCWGQQTGAAYWGLSRVSSRDTPTYDANATYLYSRLGDDVDVYVVDSGVTVTHTTFSPARARHGVTATSLRASEGDDDHNGHGTHVAGLAAGAVHGTAKGANIIAVKVLDFEGSGTVGWILEGIQWIHTNANSSRKNVINMSLGFQGTNTIMEDTIRVLANDTGTVVVAAGNSALDACLFSPAYMPEVITVGATDASDELAGFSNYGSCVDILAPGSQMLSAEAGTARDETYLSGTSMAAPLVAGLLATIVENAEDFRDIAKVKSVLLGNATVDKVKEPLYGTPNILPYSYCEDPVFTTTSVEPPTMSTTATTPTSPLYPDNGSNQLKSILKINLLVMMFSRFMAS